MNHTKEYMRLYMKKRYINRMDYCKNKLGNKCSKCGSINGLDIHHKKRNMKKFTISMEVNIRSVEELNKELENCELLCKDCHKKEHSAKHGTLSVRNCKCVECREAKGIQKK
jgi:5-methylcytosine-specific restriction endonuclease McrA